MNLLTYGDGQVYIDTDSNTLGFDIKFSGNVIAKISLPSNWIVMSTNKRMIGFSSDATPLEPTTIFNYTGNIKISSCSIATLNEKINCEIKNNAAYYWSDLSSDWTTNTTKFDAITKTQPNVNSTKIKHYNLFAKKDEYYFNKNNPVPAGTEYHIDVKTRQAYTEDLEKIYQLLGDGRLFNLKKIKRPKQIKMNPKQIKLKANEMRKNISSTSVQETKHPKDFGSDPHYDTGGSD